MIYKMYIFLQQIYNDKEINIILKYIKKPIDVVLVQKSTRCTFIINPMI